MSEEDKQLFNKMIYCSLIDGEQALKFKRKYEDLQQKIEQLENIRKDAITYILAHCEIIRHEKENIDEVGNVNGADLLNILNKGDNENG